MSEKKKESEVVDFIKAVGDSGDSDAMAKMLDTLVKGNSKLIEELTKSSHEQIATYLDSLKKHIDNIYPSQHYETENKRIDKDLIIENKRLDNDFTIENKKLDYGRELKMIEIGIEMKREADESSMRKIKLSEEIRKTRYEENLEASLGIIPLKTRYKKAMAKLLAEKDVAVFEAKLGNIGGGLPQLPDTDKKLLEE
jgi:hypothetical protein